MFCEDGSYQSHVGNQETFTNQFSGVDNSTSDIVSSQYYPSHQRETPMLHSIPSSISVFRESTVASDVKTAESIPTSSLPENDNEYFNLRIVTNDYGQEDVELEGNAKLFVTNIHDEILNFLKTYKVPIKSLCFYLLDSTNDKVIADFLSRTDWNDYSREERLLYYRLNDWICETVEKRIEDILMKETDTSRRYKLEQVSKRLMGETKKVIPGPSFVSQMSAPSDQTTGTRTKTTLEERNYIKDWTLQNSNATKQQRRQLATQMGLTFFTISRLVNYYKKKRDFQEDVQNEQQSIMIKNEPTFEIEETLSEIPDNFKIDQPAPASVDGLEVKEELNSKVELPRALQMPDLKTLPSMSEHLSITKVEDENQKLMRKSPGFKNVEITESINDVSRSGSIQEFIPTKAYKIIQGGLTTFVPPRVSPSTKATLKSDREDKSKFNLVALSSYFKTKPFPTEEEINYFVNCTKVPYHVTRAYIKKMQDQQQNLPFDKPEQNILQSSIQNQQHNLQNNFQIKQEPSQSSDPQLQDHSNHQQYYNQDYSKGQSHGYQSQPREESYNENLFSQASAGLVPELTEQQKVWFKQFITANPNPEMEAISNFANSIGMQFENVLLSLELDFNVFDNNQTYHPPEAKVQDTKSNLLYSLDSEVCQLVKDIESYCPETFSPHLESELKAMFGNKIFLTLDNVKGFASSRNLSFQDVYKKLNNFSDSIQLVSEETCRRLENTQSEVKQESINNDWLTSSDIDFDNDPSAKEAPGLSPKRKLNDEGNANAMKKLRSNDSGYVTPNVSHVEQSSVLNESLDNILTENLGSVNMLDDSLNLFNESISRVDLVNEMFDNVMIDNASEAPVHLKANNKRETEISPMVMEAIISSLEKSVVNDEPKEKSKEKPEVDSQIRKLFRGPLQNFCPTFQVLSFSPSFKPYVYEVELSDGRESCKNFYFKTGASSLEVNMMVKLKVMRHVGAKICVDNFDVVETKENVVGNPHPLDEEYFKKIRAQKIDPLELTIFEHPKTILEYIMLEENLVALIEYSGVKTSELFEESDEDVKKEILFSLCKTQKAFSNKVIKLLSSILKMRKEVVSDFIQEAVEQIDQKSSLISEEHSYGSMFKTRSK